MICEKLPMTEQEITDQLKKSGCYTKRDVGLFLIGVRELGCWNEQSCDHAYLKMIYQVIVRIATGQNPEFPN